jgi:membrane-bound ClpP family serine protease
MDISSYEIFGLLAALLGFVLHVPYLIQTIRGTIKPHPFSWILWALLTFIAFFAQFLDNAGPGAWVTGVVGTMTLLIALASTKNGFQNIKRADIAMFVIGLFTIPLWIATEDPTLSVIIVVAIDLIAFAPTYRKSYYNPYDEPLYLYSWNVLRHVITLFAIVNITIATALFPFMVAIANGSLVIFLLWRRRALKIEGKV